MIFTSFRDVNTKLTLHDILLLFVVFAITLQRISLFDSSYFTIDYVSVYLYILSSIFNFRKSFNFKRIKWAFFSITLFLVLYTVPSLVNQPIVHPAINSYIRNLWLLASASLLLINHLIGKPSLLPYVLKTIALSIAVMALFYLVSIVSDFSFGTRRRSVFGLNVNDLGFFASIGVLMCVWDGYKNKNKILYNTIYIFLLLFMILNTGSRGAALILPIILFIFFFYSYTANIVRKSVYLIFSSVIVLFFAYLFFNFGVTSDRLATSFERTDRGTIELLHDRIPMWEVAFATGRENLLFGVGGHQYALELRKLGRPFQNVHNDFLHLYVFSGLIGVSIIIFILVLLMFRLIELRNVYLAPFVIALYFIVLFQMTKGGGVIHSLYTWVILSYVYVFVNIRNNNLNK